MGSKRESPTKIDRPDSHIKIKPKMSSSGHLSASQSVSESNETLKSSFSSLLKHLEPFSPSCRDARLDEKSTPLKSQIFSPKTQSQSSMSGASRLPLESLTSNVPLPERIRTSSCRGSSLGRDDYWEPFRSHYNYLMDEGLIDTCREANDELIWEDEGVSQACYWSFTEFIQKFNELHDSLHNLQSDVVAASELEPNKESADIRKVVFEKLQLVVFGCKSFKEQAQQLGRRYPDMKDEINRRVNLLANKREALEQAFDPHQPSIPKEEGVFQEIAHEMRCLRRWLRELESRLHPLTICPSWTLDELEEKYKQQQILQKEIESRGKFVSSLLKLCDQLGEGEVTGLIGQQPHARRIDQKQQDQLSVVEGQREDGALGATPRDCTSVEPPGSVIKSVNERDEPERATRPIRQLQSWDAERIRRLASNLEKRWHAIWLRSLEWQCIIEELIQKYRSGKVSSTHLLDFSFGDEPLHKFPRLSGDFDESLSAGVRPKMTESFSSLLDPNLEVAPSPTFSSSSEPSGEDPSAAISVSQQQLLTTDRGIMVGTTGIAQLKAECGGSFGRFEIIQDVGYSSESSTQLSNDERTEFVRVYSYSPADRDGKARVTEYKFHDDKMVRVVPRTDNELIKMQGSIPSSTLGMNPSMDWQFTSEEDEFYGKHSESNAIGNSPLGSQKPLHTSSPVKRDMYLPLRSVLEDDSDDLSDDEEWLNRHSRRQRDDEDNSELEVTLVSNQSREREADNTADELDGGHYIPTEVKKLVVKADLMIREESRKRSADSTTQISADQQQPQRLSFAKNGKETSLKSARVKEWLRDCHPVVGEVVSGLDSTVEEDDGKQWPMVRKNNKKKPVGVVVDSCDASGEYTTNDSSDCDNSSSAEESQSQGDEVNDSIALSRSGTGSVETVVPLGRVEEPNKDATGVAQSPSSAPRVVLRSKKRGSRAHGDRPWSVTELHQLSAQFAASPFSTSEGALNTLIHSSSSSSVRTKLLRGSSLPKYRRSSGQSGPSLSHQQSLPSTCSSSYQTLPLRRTRRHRSRGSLHLSPTSPQSPSTLGGPQTVIPSSKTVVGTGPTPNTATTSTINTTTTDSGSEGPSPLSGQSHPSSNQQSLSGSDSAAQLSSTTGGVTSNNSKNSGGSSESKTSSSRRRRSQLGRKKSSPRTSVLSLERVKKVAIIPAATASAQTTEDQSSVSDQVWDGYEDPPYWSEPYSEQTADEDQVKRLINFGDDYRAFIGSQSDTSSSAGGFKTSEGSILPSSFRGRSGTITSQDYQDETDSDSDVEELQHVMAESLRALQFAQNTICQQKNAPLPPSDCAELLASCQTNLKCLQVIAEHLDTGPALRNLTSDDFVHLQSLISGWEMLQTTVLSSQSNGQKYKDVRLEIADLRDKMSDLALVASANHKPFADVTHLEKRIETLQASLSTLQETKATLLAVNLKVHRLLTEAGLTLSSLKDDVTDLYRRWDDVYEQSGAKLSELQEAHGTWQRFNQNRQKLFDLLTLEENSDQENGDSLNDPYRKLAERSSKANEAQELVIGLHQDSKTLEPFFGTSGKIWSDISRDLKELGLRVNKLQQDVAVACRRQSVVETPSLSSDLGSSFGTQPSDSSCVSVVENRSRRSSTLREIPSTPVSEIPSARVIPQPKLHPVQDISIDSLGEIESTTSVRGKKKEVSEVGPVTPVPGVPRRRSRFWRVVRAAIPIQMALVLLYCLAWLLEPHCCDVLNNMNFSFTPTLRYIRGPPPV